MRDLRTNGRDGRPTARRHPGALAVMVMLVALVGGCASPHRSPAVNPSTALQAPPGDPLSAWTARVADHDGTASSAVHLLADGASALAMRLALIDAATTAVDLQVYIYGPDRSSDAVSEALARAAARGVRVRLLLDDWGDKPGDDDLARLASRPNIEVRLYNPIATPGSPLLAMLVDFGRTNRRMHNKLMVVDGRAAVIGGRNVGDAYFARSTQVAFGDLDAVVAGPVVADLARSFDAYWNAPGHAAILPAPAPAVSVARMDTRPMDTPRVAASSRPISLPAMERVAAHALADPPDKSRQPAAGATSAVAGGFAATAGDARHSLVIVSPYFVPGAAGVEWLAGLRRRGVAVTVVTNSLAATDVPAVHAGYARHRQALLEAGVELHEVRPDAAHSPSGDRSGGLLQVVRRSLHAKVLVVDGRWTFIGSMNLDPRSLRLNTENGLVVDSPAVADRLATGLLASLPASTWRVVLHEGRMRWIETRDAGEAMHDGEPGAGLWRRVQATVLSWLPIDALL
jgi:putative cardiolipin synthase